MSRINKMCNFNHGMTIRVSKCLPIYIYIYILSAMRLITSTMRPTNK